MNLKKSLKRQCNAPSTTTTRFYKGVVMVKNMLGSSPRTTIAGCVLAGLLSYQAVAGKGPTDYKEIGVAVSIAVLGRLMKDSDGVNRRKGQRIAKKVLPEQHP